MMTGNTAIHIASQLQSGAPRKAAFLVAVRPIALNRRNSLFAGLDQGAVNWACIASLIETAKLQDIDPKPYLADILSKLVNGWPMAKIDELLPWAWAQHSKARLAA